MASTAATSVCPVSVCSVTTPLRVMFPVHSFQCDNGGGGGGDNGCGGGVLAPSITLVKAWLSTPCWSCTTS